MQLGQFAGGLGYAEAPRWHDGELWVSDIQDRRVVVLGPSGEIRREVEVAARPSGIGFRPDGTALVVSMEEARVLAIVDGATSVVADLSGLGPGAWNDAVADGEGGLYVGCFGREFLAEGELVPAPIALVRRDGSAAVVAHDLMNPNGMWIDQRGRTLIVAESGAGRLTAFDRARDGTLSNRREFADLGERVPDGICGDASGAVWVGCPLPGEVLRIDPDGRITEAVPVDGGMPIACALGGHDGRTLFVVVAHVGSEGFFETIAAGESHAEVVMGRVAVPGAGPS